MTNSIITELRKYIHEQQLLLDSYVSGYIRIPDSEVRDMMLITVVITAQTLFYFELELNRLEKLN